MNYTQLENKIDLQKYIIEELRELVKDLKEANQKLEETNKILIANGQREQMEKESAVRIICGLIATQPDEEMVLPDIIMASIGFEGETILETGRDSDVGATVLRIKRSTVITPN